MAPGVRDEGPLKSALARAQQIFAYARKPSIIDMAAAHTAGIVRNHPFIDGNKRTGFILGALFLELNGWRLTASEENSDSKRPIIQKLSAVWTKKREYQMGTTEAISNTANI